MCSNCDNKTDFENIDDTLEILCLKCGFVQIQRNIKQTSINYENKSHIRCQRHETKLDETIVNYIDFLQFDERYKGELKLLLNFETLAKDETKIEVLKKILIFAKKHKITLKPLRQHAEILRVSPKRFGDFLKETDIGFINETMKSETFRCISSLRQLCDLYRVDYAISLKIYEKLNGIEKNEGEMMTSLISVYIQLKLKKDRLVKSKKRFIEQSKVTSVPTFCKVLKRYDQEFRKMKFV